MSEWPYREFYRRHLPHYQPPGATLFITFRLAGSLEELEAEAQRQERRLEAIAECPTTSIWCARRCRS